MDRILREEIRADVTKAVKEILMASRETYILPEDVCKQFPMITPKLLKEHGDIFPRKRIKMTGTNGKTRTTRWAYAQNQIAINIASGLYDDLNVMREL